MEDVEIQKLLNMAAEVLVSEIIYRPALAANIKAFYESIDIKKANQELRDRVIRIETDARKDRSMFEERLAALEKRKGCGNPTGCEEESPQKKAI